MSNILNIEDIINSMKKIENDCEIVSEGSEKTMKYQKFYEQVKGLMILVEENSQNKKGGGFMMG